MQKFLSILFLLVLASCSTAPEKTLPVVGGVSLELAEYRSNSISDINYMLTFTIPSEVSAPIEAKEVLTFKLSDISQDLQLDFREDARRLTALTVNGRKRAIKHSNEHLVIKGKHLKLGENILTIDFYAGVSSLNRHTEYLYTLFVPERARTAFPLFDQPNLKATYDLTLDIPEKWTAIAGGGAKNETTQDGRKTIIFDRSDLMSSYLFSFVAGKFEEVTRTVNGYEMTMLHRETDKQKVAGNLDAIFELHASSLAWLETYTDIKYPFKKIGFALIPSFQYGGMEHVGAIQYRASTLFLDENPSQNSQLSRANLIAHELAHMWFGDLVTMNWFDDVWTKEVFANFIAAKMVNPAFPEIDHDLSFILRHYPSAYSVDRSEGANPIRQPLPNLNEAGNLYGAIIYNKAPIMMQQLEMLVGKELFQKGLQEYLKTFSHGNATWPDLISILDKKSDEDLNAWSDTWVNTAGRPEFTLTGSPIDSLDIIAADPTGMNRVWAQRFNVSAFFLQARDNTVNIKDNEKTMTGFTVSDFVMANSDGRGYGLFPANKAIAENKWQALSNVQKASLLINLYEQMMEGTIAPETLLNLNIALLAKETNPLLINYLRGRITAIYWNFIPEDIRFERAGELEAFFWTSMKKAKSSSQKKSYFRSYRAVAQTPEAIARLKAIWSKKQSLKGIKLVENDYINLATTLALRLPSEAEEILAAQLSDIKNPDRRMRFEFLVPSLSADAAVRDDFFESLKLEENRATESWVLSALNYLHSPFHGSDSEKYILPSLELLEEIQRTGDIFFPGRWVISNLSQHRSPEAATAVRQFLDARPNYNHQLTLKILQGADPLFRKQSILN